MRVAVIALALALIGCHVQTAPQGELNVDGLARVYAVGEGIYRGPQASGPQWAALVQQLGIKSDIKLNLALEGRDVLPADVTEYDHPWLPFGPVSHSEVADALWDLDHAPRPVYIHCTHGEDRTGLLVGLYRTEHFSLTCAAWGEMIAYGFHDGETNRPGLAEFVEAFKRETGGGCQ